MNTSLHLRNTVLAAAIAASSLFALPATAAPMASDLEPAPGSFRAIMSVKDPQNWGRHLPTADRPAEVTRGAHPGSFAAILSVKLPGVYGTHLPGNDEPICPNAYRHAPGSFAALMQVKLPGVYGPRSCAGL